MSERGQGQGRMIWVEQEAWAEALRWAEALDCLTPTGEPSIGRLVTDIGNGAVQVKRVKAAQPRSLAGRIRAMIDQAPAAKDAEIARLLDTTPLRVLQERRRYAERKTRNAIED